MAKIDSLEIEIMSSVGDVNRELDKLDKRLNSVSRSLANANKNSSMKEIVKQSRELSDSMQTTSNQIKSSTQGFASSFQKANKPMEEMKKSVSEIANEFQQKFKDFTPKIDFSKSTESLKKLLENYSQSMIKAQNDLNRIMVSSSADKQEKSIERYIIKINEAKNGIKSIQQYLDSISVNDIQPEFKIIGAEEAKKTILDFQNDLIKFDDIIESGGEKTDIGISFPVAELEASLSQLREMFPEAEDLISSYEAEIERASELASKTPFMQYEKIDLEPYVRIKEEIYDFDKALQGIRPIEFTGNFYEMEQFVDSLKDKLYSLTNRIEKLNAMGVNPDSQSIKNLQYDLQTVSVTLDKYESKLEEARQAGQLDINIPNIDSEIDGVKSKFYSLKETMRGMRIVIPTDSLKQVETDIQKVQDKYNSIAENIRRKSQTVNFYGASQDFKNKQIELEALKNQYQELINKQKELAQIGGGGYKLNISGFTDSAKSLQKSLQPLSSTLQRVTRSMSNFGKNIISAIIPTKRLGKSNKDLSSSLSGGFKTFLKYGLGIRSVFVLFNRLRRAIKEGFGNLVLYSDETSQSVNMLKSSFGQLKNATAAAISPLFNAFAPALNYVIKLCVTATNYINQLFSALTGKSTWIKAKDYVNDWSDSVSGASKAAKGALQPFDELNNLTSDTGSGGGGGASGAGDMFEDAQVETKFKELADKLKSIVEGIFAPLKTAWENEGQFVIDSWKSSLGSIWDLIKDIGSDFLTVWNQSESIHIFSNILHIIGDIGLTVSNLVNNFRSAWNENQTGLRILEDIRDIYGVIVENVRNAADFTVDWASNLDFTPLLEAFENLTSSLAPVIDNISGALSDFYTQVLLPLGKWTIEKGLPDLLNVFADFNSKVDWESLRANLSEFWSHLEPFAETVGEGLIIFIERVSNLVANFVNSDTFKNFLDSLGRWMDSVSPEDVANGIQTLVTAFIALKGVLLAFQVGGTISKALTGLQGSLLGLKALGTIAIAVTVAVEGWNLGQKIYEWISGEKIDMTFSQQVEFIFNADSSEISDALSMMALDIEDWVSETNEKISNSKFGKFFGFGSELKEKEFEGFNSLLGTSERERRLGLKLGVEWYEDNKPVTGNQLIDRIISMSNDLSKNWQGKDAQYNVDTNNVNGKKNKNPKNILKNTNKNLQSVWTDKTSFFAVGTNILNGATVQNLESAVGDLSSKVQGSFKDKTANYGIDTNNLNGSKTSDLKSAIQNLHSNLKNKWTDNTATFGINKSANANQGTVSNWYSPMASIWKNKDSLFSISKSSNATTNTVNSWYNPLSKIWENKTSLFDIKKSSSANIGTVNSWYSQLADNWKNKDSVFSISKSANATESNVKSWRENLVKYWGNMTSVAEIKKATDAVPSTITGWRNPLVDKWQNATAMFKVSKSGEATASNVKTWYENLKSQWKDAKSTYSIQKSSNATQSIVKTWNESLKSKWTNATATYNITKGANATAEKVKSWRNSIVSQWTDKTMTLNATTNVGVGDSSKLKEWLNKNFVDKLNSFSFAGIKFNIPRFAMGGFPEDGLFYANHGELVGQFSNGKTAVANNDQITQGIANAVYNANRESNALMRQEIALMQRQNELLVGILEKETGISAQSVFDNVRKYATDYARRTGNSPFPL